MSKAEMINTLASYMEQQQDCNPDNACAEIANNEAIEFASWLATKYILRNPVSLDLVTDLYSLFKQQKG